MTRIAAKTLTSLRRSQGPDLTTGALTHDTLWAAIESLARRHNTSLSNLARSAGLDPTSFSPSKRISPQGRPRWPSTESLAKVLAATGTSLDAFLGLVDPGFVPCRAEVALIPCSLRAGKLVTSPIPPQEQRLDDKVSLPGLSLAETFAVRVQGAAFAPVYRDGDVLLVSLRETLRRGDRVLLCLRNGQVQVFEMRRQTAAAFTLVGLAGKSEEEIIPYKRIAWIGRILWVAQ